MDRFPRGRGARSGQCRRSCCRHCCPCPGPRQTRKRNHCCRPAERRARPRRCRLHRESRPPRRAGSTAASHPRCRGRRRRTAAARRPPPRRGWRQGPGPVLRDPRPGPAHATAAPARSPAARPVGCRRCRSVLRLSLHRRQRNPFVEHSDHSLERAARKCHLFRWRWHIAYL